MPGPNPNDPPMTNNPPKVGLQILLLAVTLLTTIWAGALHLGIDLLQQPSAWIAGLPYALALLAVLGVHEMGHYLMARRRGVEVSLPYFIPAPSSLGTFGAFIRISGTIPTRATYFDVGIAGPLAGLVIALGALYFGLRWEQTMMAAGHGLVPASSLLLAGIYHLALHGDVTTAVQVGPVAYAGWLGLIVTALNLLPVGQLDGGHIAYAMLGRTLARRVSIGFVVALVAGGLLLRSHLWIWGLIAWLLAGTDHPPAVDDQAPVGMGRKLLGAGALVLLMAILIPLPR